MAEVLYSPRARHDLKRLDEQIRKRVVQKVDRHVATGHGARQLKGPFAGTLCLRAGDWRVFLDRDTETQAVRVMRVLHRSVAYKQP